MMDIGIVGIQIAVVVCGLLIKVELKRIADVLEKGSIGIKK